MTENVKKPLSVQKEKPDRQPAGLSGFLKETLLINDK